MSLTLTLMWATQEAAQALQFKATMIFWSVDSSSKANSQCTMRCEASDFYYFGSIHCGSLCPCVTYLCTFSMEQKEGLNNSVDHQQTYCLSMQSLRKINSHQLKAASVHFSFKSATANLIHLELSTSNAWCRIKPDLLFSVAVMFVLRLRTLAKSS